MSQDNPTPEELSEIEQFQYGAYGAEPPEWWINQKNTRRPVVPDEAMEAAHRAWREQAALDGSIFEYNLRAAIEAAAPILLSHEREQTRLAHIDAMVNRETKQSELAAAWDEGERVGFEESFRDNDPRTTRNPYRE